MFKNKMIYTAIIKRDKLVIGEVFNASHSRAEALDYAVNNFKGKVIALVAGNQEVFSIMEEESEEQRQI